MALDGIFLHSLLTDLKNTLINLKIDKINQPEKDEIVLSFRKNRQNIKLMLSSSPTFPRIHFVTEQKANPLTAPMFLMVLRKYLVGGTINEIIQKDGDRIVIFKIEADSTFRLIDCNFTGYSGRLAIQEVLKITPELREAIVQGKSKAELDELVKKNEYCELLQDGIKKVLTGQTTFAELQRVAYNIID